MAKNKDHHLHKIGDVYYFRTMVNGKQIKKALSSSVTEARRQRDELLKEIMISGEISKPEPIQYKSLLFGEVAKEWVKIKEKEVKSSTLRDYKCAMNYYLLPKFGKTVIKDIGYKDIKMFILTLKCSAKRINNVLVPMRSLFQYAIDAEYIDKNPFSRVRNQKVVKPEIHPLSMDEVQTFLNFVPPRYKNFFVVAFFTGMRFGEMAALDWKHVDFEWGIIKITKTRVNGEEGSPKTKKSARDIKMMPPVVEALKDQKKLIAGKFDYVFLNHEGNPVVPGTVNKRIWNPTLRKAGLAKRSLYQTRHTFATLMLDSGELPGWVQQMLGHESLQMILEKYYSHVKNYQRDDGSSFMQHVFQPSVGSSTVIIQP